MVPPERFLFHRAQLLAFLNSRATAAADAEDVLQEVWMELLERPPRHERGLKTWLRLVASRRLQRHSERSASRARRERAVARPESVPSPAEDLGQASAFERLRELVDALDEPYRGVLQLRFFEGLEITELAQRTGRPEPTVRSQIKRGLDRLRERVGARRDRGGAWRFMPALWTRSQSASGASETSAATALSSLQALAALALTAAVAGGLWYLRGAPPAPAAAPIAAPALVEALERPPGESARRLSLPESAALTDPVEPRDALADELALRGSVRLATSGAAVPAARILAASIRSPEDVREIAACDDAGAFSAELRELPAWVWAEAEGFAAVAQYRVDAGFVERGNRLDITGHARGVLAGTVTFADGSPVSGADVRLVRPGQRPERFGGQRLIERDVPRISSRTDARGHFELPRSGSLRCNVEVELAGAAPWRGWVDESTQELSVVLPEPAALGGRVAARGERLADAHLSLFVDGRWQHAGRTDAGGNFAFSGLTAGEFVLTVKDAREGTGLALVHRGRFAEGESLDLGVLEAGTDATLAGRVHVGARALVGWRVERVLAANGGSGARRGAEAISREDGSFAFAGVGGELGELWLFPPGDDEVLPRARWLGLGAGDFADLDLGPVASSSASVGGRLVSASPRPVLPRVAWFQAELAREFLVSLDGDGRFEIGPVFAGAGELRVFAPERGPLVIERLELASGERVELGDVLLPEPCALEVELGLPANVPFRAYTFQLERDGLVIASNAHAPARGVDQALHRASFRVDDLWPGKYHLSVQAPYLQNVSLDVELEAGFTRSLALEMHSGDQGIFRVIAPRPLARDETVEVLFHEDGRAAAVPIEDLEQRVVRGSAGFVLGFRCGIPPGATALEVRTSRGLSAVHDLVAHPILQGERCVLELAETAAER